MTTFDDFGVGDRVHHHGAMGAGTVTAIDDCVHVTFDRATGGRYWRGAYDRTWFRINPHLLSHACAHLPTQDDTPIDVVLDP